MTRANTARPIPEDLADRVADMTSNDDLCRIYGVTKTVLDRWLKQAGLTGIRPRGGAARPGDVDQAGLLRMATRAAAGATADQIAQDCNCSPARVYYVARAQGICGPNFRKSAFDAGELDPRWSGLAPKNAPGPEAVARGIAARTDLPLGLSVAQVADLCGVPRGPGQYRMLGDVATRHGWSHTQALARLSAVQRLA